jgi:WD40 repeat protein
VCSLAFLELGGKRMMITGGKDGKIKLWDIESGELERAMTASMGPIMEMIVIHDSKQFQVISMSNKVKFFSIK